MNWTRGDLIDVARHEGITHVAFTANAEVTAGKALVMGAGAAKRIRDYFLGIDKVFASLLEFHLCDPASHRDYRLMTYTTHSEGWLGVDWISDVVTVSAVQVKRRWQEPGDLQLTRESLVLLRGYVREKEAAGLDARCVINCPLIGHGGWSLRKGEVYEMVEAVFQHGPVTVCER